MKNQTYHIVTIGCQMNKSDSERVAGYLEERGFLYSNNPNKSGLVIITTCGVRQSAEDRVYGLAPKIKKANSKVKIILTGCLSQRQDVRRRLKNYVDIWLPITELDGLYKKLGVKNRKTEKETKFPIGNLVSTSGSLKNYLNITPKHKSRFSAFVPIGNGCDNFCSYCVVPYARGREVYRPAAEIVSEVKNLVKRGYKEIILIAQNVNSYVSKKQQNKKATKQVNFPELLRKVNDIEGDFWIRFATSHPKDMSDELIKAIAEYDKVCEHIHLPAQSGDNGILRAMNRKYNKEHYISLIKKIRKYIPETSITTDIIVGFPGETKKQFNNTAKLFEKAKFDMAYIAQYSPRPGTASFKMKDNVSKNEKKRREEVLTKILRKTALENNKKYIGKTVEVLVEGENRNGAWYGKTRTNKQVRINKLELTSLIGQFVGIKIKKVKDFGLEGELESKKVKK
jgi:tRNA-2-methylthio-N6-dimethylallyladenosine synthase